ncbi:MAG: hypothetical protein JWM73_2975 [Solirubrobacterales bacterium]|nr:hypothetical protein [Solirubrobacterales bacterium]
MSGSAATLPARAPAAPASLAERSSARVVAWGLGACLALAALTLIAPSQPTYDPWSWILWGREIAHGHLSTSFGPSWKPLPVALTTVFSLFGDTAPTLWVLVARAGALAGVLYAFVLGRRLAGPWAGLLAGAVVLLAPWYVRNAALANSEGLQVAFALAAVERALAGRRMPAFWLGLGLALLRPEAWPFLGLYGAWLVWRERATLVPVAAGLVSLPLLWLVPEQIGSGDWLRAAHRAADPVSGSPADAANPVVEVVREGWGMLGGGSWLHWGLLAGVAAALWLRDRRLLALGGLVAAWTLVVGVMTANGYSGNTRYLIVPAALAMVIAAAGLVLGLRAVRAPAPAVALAGVGLAALFVVPWLDRVDASLSAARYQAQMTEQLSTVVDRAGGPGRVLACGPVTTGAYLVPAVAWHLGLRIEDVRLVAERPGTTLRVHTTDRSSALPTLTPLAGVAVKTLAFTPAWRIVTTCGAGS